MAGKPIQPTVNKQRRAGVLLHPTSLPGSLASGDIGHQVYRFIEFISAHGFKVWQMLPLGPTHNDKSPYQCLSSHAGNPLLISLDWLIDRGWLSASDPTAEQSPEQFRLACLKQAGEYFYKTRDAVWLEKLSTFTQKHHAWLDDYSLYIAFKQAYADSPWYEWPVEARHRDTDALNKARQIFQDSIQQTVFEQFVFFTQWHEIRTYARQHQVELFGDVPIFVAHDSADVWAQRKNFLMDDDGVMQLIAGVPPDAFSDTGQRWGNPLYDWEYMRTNNYQWWKQRFQTQLELFDMVRIDHFRGLQACWQIPQQDDTAMHGSWVEVPGKEMLEAIFQTFNELPLVAEDLGVITEPVIELKKHFNLPGMKVLQFAFDGNTHNPHLPHNHEVNDIVYTGTHDNDTTRGWVSDVKNYNESFLQEYTNTSFDTDEQGVWTMIRIAMSSVSFLCMLPMQDILMLDSTARMNRPGTIGGNWLWRFEWESVKQANIEKLSRLITLYQR